MLHAQARAALAELDGDVGVIAEVVDSLTQVIGLVGRDHSPLDWAAAQLALAGVLQTLGEAADCEAALDKAIGAYERALAIIGAHPAVVQRSWAAHQHAVCLIRRAELRFDLASLNFAEAAFRAELAVMKPAKDPAAWAVLQLNFARLYEARAYIAGWRKGDREAATTALAAALDVFGEQGMRTLADTAQTALRRLRAIPAKPAATTAPTKGGSRGRRAR